LLLGGGFLAHARFLFCVRVGDPPDAHGAVATGGGNSPAIGEVGHTRHDGGMTFVFVDLVAALHVPDVSVLPAGDDALAVGRERGATGGCAAVDVRLLVGVGPERLQHVAGLHVPDDHPAVPTRRQETLAVG